MLISLLPYLPAIVLGITFAGVIVFIASPQGKEYQALLLEYRHTRNILPGPFIMVIMLHIVANLIGGYGVLLARGGWWICIVYGS